MKSSPVLALGLSTFLAVSLIRPLGAQSTALRIQVRLPARGLVLRQEPIVGRTVVTHVDIAGLDPKHWQTQPGLPNLPYTYRYVALPLGARITGLEVRTGDPITREGVSLIGWAQSDQPSVTRDPLPPDLLLDPDTRQPIYYPHRTATPLDLSFARASVWPAREQVVLAGVEEKGGFQVAKLLIHPVQWYPASELLRYTPTIEVALLYEGGRTFAGRNSYRQSAELEDLSTLVANPEVLPHSIDSYPRFPTALDAWYLIITDNYEWAAEAIERGAAIPGDMVAELQRLADWKTQKGVKAEVVTITDIVDGRYGDFLTGSRDLQEVLRKFLKHAYTEFGTYWVLLGGDVAVLPARYIVAEHTSDDSYFAREPQTKPEAGKCYWDEATDTVRIHTLGNVLANTVISTAATGRAFAQVSNPSLATPGWAFATSDSYATTTMSATDFVILRGPLSHTRDQDFYAAASTNSIPTDLYYASLVGPDYDIPGLHDWDKNNNEVYGQYHGDTSIDGVDYQPDLAVGRAPVQTGAEAKIFVDKVIGYELHTDLPQTFAHTLLLGSSNWSSSPSVTSGSDAQPPVGKYYSADGSTTAHLHFDGPPDPEFSWRLIAYDEAGDWWIVPFNRSASAENLGWHYCTSATYNTVSEQPYSLNDLQLYLPVATEYVRVRGPANQIHPVKYFFDREGMDRSAKEKEDLKLQFESDFPSLDTRKRLYQDLLDVPDYPAPDLFELTSTLMQSELNAGYNLVSLSGHGNPSGCCGVTKSYVQNLQNGARAGIVYANSCLTAKFDASDSVGEEFLKNSTGGAVAYIGCSRFGWVKAGGAFENTFWKTLAQDRHLGRLHNSKALLVDSTNGRWTNFSLNLLGDPEMEVWVDAPPRLDIDIPVAIEKGLPIPIWTHGVPSSRICVLGPRGWMEIRHTGEADRTEVSTDKLEVGDVLLLTVTSPGFLPFQQEVEVTSGGEERLIRGDANQDGSIDISDARFILGVLFLGQGNVRCPDAADANDDGSVDISDPLEILGYLFLGAPLPPGTTPGQPQVDATPDGLGCDA